MKKAFQSVFMSMFFFGLLSVPASAQQEIFELVRKGDVAAVEALVEKSPAALSARDSNGSQPLHIAAQNDLRDVAAALLEKGAAIEARDDYGRTPLIACARERGTAATGRLLLQAGADVNAVDKFGSDALELAAWRGKTEFIDLLLENGAKIPTNRQKLGALFTMSASQGLPRLFDRLRGSGIDLKSVADPDILCAAAGGGSPEIISALLGAGLSPADRDRYGWTPLHYAARDGRTEAVRTLLEKGAPIDARSIMGQSAYDVAVERKMADAAALLAKKGADTSGIRFPDLLGDYLGQKPPAAGSELFGLGLISSIWGIHSTAVFSPDGNEVMWAPMVTYPDEVYSRGGLLTMRRVDGRWTPPAWAPFSGADINDDVPFYTPDGQRLYFISRRPLPGRAGSEKERIWVVDRRPTGWSEPRPLEPALNDHEMHWSFSLDAKGDLYFGGQGPDQRGMGDIYVSRFVDGHYQKPVNMGDPINTAQAETTPFVAYDGGYLLFSRQFDLWVSFRGADGGWGEPVKLGPEVNSPSIELCPVVTADGKYLFFLSQRDGESHAYWVPASVIEKARPAKSAPPAGTAAPGSSPADALPLHLERMSDRILFAWAGDWMQSIRVVGLKTARGIVVVEANLSRSIDARIRKAIETEFGRTDFASLINTHSHHDHTLGNQVYADVPIIAHRTAPEEMKSEQAGEGLTKTLEMFRGMAADWRAKLTAAAPGSNDQAYYREAVALADAAIVEVQDGFRPTYPTVLFDTSRTLDMGDLTLELYSVGGTHTQSDIMIFIPEEGLVAIGDMWPDRLLPILMKKAPWNLGAILESWGKIVASGREIKRVNMAHSDMSLGVETFKQQYRYLKTLWDGLREMKARAATLAEAKARYTIEKDFPFFEDRITAMRGLDIHQNNIEAIWERIVP